MKYVSDPKWSICIPQQLQEWLIDDFDLVIQQNKLLKLPSEKSVTTILSEYLKHKVSEDEEHSKNKAKIQEAISGLSKYFNVMLGSQLLYKFERIQYTQASVSLNKNLNIPDMY
jgi:mortality factor 4-like protein 1